MDNQFEQFLNDSTLHYLATTNELALVYMYEDGYLLHLGNKEILHLGSFYGSPSCGAIDINNKWAVMGGLEGFLLWQQGSLEELPFPNAYEIRQVDNDLLHILTDPWTEDCAIWEFNINTQQFSKIRDFKDYQDKEYTEDVKW